MSISQVNLKMISKNDIEIIIISIIVIINFTYHITANIYSEFYIVHEVIALLLDFITIAISSLICAYLITDKRGRKKSNFYKLNIGVVYLGFNIIPHLPFHFLINYLLI